MNTHFLPMSFEKYRQKYRQKEKLPGFSVNTGSTATVESTSSASG
jgi:hypothetical protein